MSRKNLLAVFLLTTALVAAPCLTGAAYAHDHEDWDQASGCREDGLPEAKIKLLHETMHRLHESDRPVFEDMHKLHESLHQLLAADTFDSKSFLSITAQIEAKKAQLEKSRMRAFASIADQFTPEERQHLAHMFWGHHHGGMRRAGMREGGGHHEWRHHGWHEGWHHGDEQKDGDDHGEQNQPVPEQASGDGNSSPAPQ